MTDEPLEPGDGELGQVIALRTGYDPDADGVPLKKKPKELPTSAPCRHRQAVLDPEKRTLTCQHCDLELDPFDFVDKLAQDWTWFQRRVDEAKLRTRNAEQAADRRVKELERLGRRPRNLPVPIGKRIGMIATKVGKAQSALSEAFAGLAKVHDMENPSLVDWHLQAAESLVGKARADFARLLRDHGRKPVDGAPSRSRPGRLA